MSFSDKMRDSLGAQGARIEVAPPSDSVAPGAQVRFGVTIVGGAQLAVIEGLIVRLVESTRHWVAKGGSVLAEADVPARDERKHLTPGWDQAPVAELRVDVGHTVQPGESHTVELELCVPEICQPSAVGRSHTVNVQADIKGQIDPTGNARITVL